jgi:hypothetical protein
VYILDYYDIVSVVNNILRGSSVGRAGVKAYIRTLPVEQTIMDNFSIGKLIQLNNYSTLFSYDISCRYPKYFNIKKGEFFIILEKNLINGEQFLTVLCKYGVGFAV